jgi:glycosyltransferase involved in cell wall biosynthesis
MKLSVLINNYNYARFLSEALASVSAQSLAPHEIIVVDDGSTDESLQVLENLAATTPGLRIHAQTNGGQISALRAAVMLATGDWCVFLDADDTWAPDHLAELTAAIAGNPEISAYYCAHRETEGPPVYRIPWPAGALGPSMALVYVTRLRIGTLTSAISLRLDMARQAVELDPSLYADWRIRADDCLVYGAALSGAIAYHNTRSTVHYRIHGGNFFARRDRSLAEYRDKFRLARLCAFFAERNGIHERDLPDHIERELEFPHNAAPYVRRRYRRAIRRLRVAGLLTKVRLYLKSLSCPASRRFCGNP